MKVEIQVSRQGEQYKLLAFCDDTDIIGRSEEDMEKFFVALKTAADAMGLQVHEGKT